MAPYDQETEQTMKRFYDTLSEKDRRRYAGSEALRYGPGGRSYIAQMLGCSRRTVSRGAKEVSQLCGAEVGCRIDRGRLDEPASWTDEERRRGRGDHRREGRNRQPVTNSSHAPRD